MRHEKDSRAPMQPLFLKGLLSLWSRASILSLSALGSKGCDRLFVQKDRDATSLALLETAPPIVSDSVGFIFLILP